METALLISPNINISADYHTYLPGKFPLCEDQVQLTDEFHEVGGKRAGDLPGGLFGVRAVGNLLHKGGTEVQYFLILAHKA